MREPDHGCSDVDQPIDPDLGPRRHPLACAGLVAVGGAAGTTIRALLSEQIPALAGVPFDVLLINLSGAYLLGLLLAVLNRLGPDVGRRQTVRLLCGTGLLGGFTTYSALATDTALLAGSGDPMRGVGYALITVLGGALLSLAGILTGRAAPVPVGDRRPS